MKNGNGSRQSLLAASHRHLGLVTATIVLFLAITGLALNHADGLPFLERTVESEALLRWYGLSPSGSPVGFRVGDRWAVGLDGRIFLDGAYLGSSDGALVGAVPLGDLAAIATREEVLLTTNDEPPELVERLGLATLPGPIERVGTRSTGELGLRTADGLYLSDRDFVKWRRIEGGEQAGVRWSTQSPLPESLRIAVLRDFRGQGIPLSQVLADLHSGRFFGRYGSVLMDGAAVLLVLLTLSGIYNWLRRPQPRSR